MISPILKIVHSLHLDICPWTLSVSRSSQFFESVTVRFSEQIHNVRGQLEYSCIFSRQIGRRLFIYFSFCNYTQKASLHALTLPDVICDPVNIGANTGVHRKCVAWARSAGHPWGCSTEDPPTTLHTRQGATTVAITDAASSSSHADHGTLIYWSSICSPTLAVTRHWRRCLFQARSKCVGIRVNPSPSCML